MEEPIVRYKRVESQKIYYRYQHQSSNHHSQITLLKPNERMKEWRMNLGDEACECILC